MDNEKIIEFVKSAIKKVYDNHIYLIENRVHERSIVFWFGIYFYELLKDTEFALYNLDFEYNKNHSEPKRTENFPQGTYPDIILHKRGSNEKNLLAMEFKTHWSPNTKQDIMKLMDFTKQNGKYKYKLGVSVVVNKDMPPELSCVIDGEVQEKAHD